MGMNETITIKCSECGWTFTGSEMVTEIAFDEHCMNEHPDPPKSEEKSNADSEST